MSFIKWVIVVVLGPALSIVIKSVADPILGFSIGVGIVSSLLIYLSAIYRGVTKTTLGDSFVGLIGGIIVMLFINYCANENGLYAAVIYFLGILTSLLIWTLIEKL